jgi:Ubiquitin-conjugating enzyme
MAVHSSTSSALRFLQLELKKLQEEPVEGFRVHLPDDSNIFVWEVAIFGPPETLYEGGYFKVCMTTNFCIINFVLCAFSLLVPYLKSRSTDTVDVTRMKRCKRLTDAHFFKDSCISDWMECMMHNVMYLILFRYDLLLTSVGLIELIALFNMLGTPTEMNEVIIRTISLAGCCNKTGWQTVRQFQASGTELATDMRASGTELATDMRQDWK